MVMEFKRVFTNKKLIIIIVILCVIAVFSFIDDNNKIDKDEYTKKQNEHVDNYSEYIDSVLEQGNTILGVSIFQNEDNYSYKNLQKTYDDYSKMQNIIVKKGDYQSIEKVLRFNVIEVICALFAIVVVWYFFEDEKKGLKTIIYSTCKGRYHLAINRIGILALSSALFVVFVYMLVLGVSILIYGKPDSVMVPVQSIPYFKNFTLDINLLAYCGLYLVIQITKTVVLGMFVWMIMIVFNNKIISLGVLIIIFIIEGTLHFKLPEQSVWAPLKYINLFQLIQSGDTFYKYKNINLCGVPFSLANIFILFEMIVLVVTSVVCVLISQYKKSVKVSTKIEQMISNYVKNVQKIIHLLLSKMSLLGMEIYKILINQKGIIVLCVWLIFLFLQIDTNNVFLMGNKTVMSEIYEEYSGEDDGRLKKFFCSNIENLNNVQIKKIEEQLLYMDEIKSEKNIDVWFMDQKPYNVLWTENGLYVDSDYKKQETYGVFVIIALILLLSNLFSYDKICGMKSVIHTTVKGRQQLFNIRSVAVLIITFLICVVVYGIELYEVNKIYPLTCLNAPVQSIMCMEEFPLEVSILEYMIFVEVVHYLCAVSISFISLAIKEIVGGVKGLIVAIVVLLLPGILKIFGFEWCKYISVVQPLILVESYIEHGLIYSLIQITVLVVVSVLSFVYLRKKWCRS